MAVEFVKGYSSSRFASTFPDTVATTIGGDDNQIDDNFYLVVFAVDTTTGQLSAVSLAGQSCTLRTRLQVPGNYPTIEVWYVDHPGGGGEAITYTADFSPAGVAFAVLEFSGADPDPLGSIWGGLGTSTTPTAIVDNVVEESLVVGTYGIFGNAITGTPQSGDTELTESPNDNHSLITTAEPQPAASGSITVGTILGLSRSWLAVGIELLKTGTTIKTGAAVLAGVGDLSPTGQALEGGNPTVTLTGIGNLSPTGTARSTNGAAILTGVGSLSATARLDDIYRDESQADSGGVASVDQAPTGP